MPCQKPSQSGFPKKQRVFLDKLAGATDRSRNNLISSAIEKMMENYKYVLAQIEIAEADIAAGRLYSTEEVARETQDIIDRALARKK